MANTLRFKTTFSLAPVLFLACTLATIRAQEKEGGSSDETGQHESVPSNEASTEAKQQPASPPSATVIDVKGTADWAPPDTSPLKQEGWTPIQLKDSLKPGTLIRTGLRSFVNLQFGDTTTISVRSASFASIDQFYREATTETVRVGLGYGTIRGGSREETIQADVEVAAPVATLAKRGTEGWEIAVEAGTGRFRISLAEHGLLQAIQTARGRRIASRSVRPGEYVTSSNIANLWINQDIFDRTVALFDANFLTKSEAESIAAESGSFSTLNPGVGSELFEQSGRSSRSFALSNLAGRGFRPTVPTLPIGVSAPMMRPEGNFGTAGIFKRR